MNVPIWVWVVTLAAFTAVFTVDLVRGVRHPHPVTPRAAAIAITTYAGLAAAFAVGLWVLGGGGPAVQFVTGYLLEYSLSVDNLFVYLLIMSSLAVPDEQRSNVLLVGVVGTLLLRFPFIAGGVALVDRFTATFYVFGAILFWTALGLLRGDKETAEVSDHIAIRLARRLFPTSDSYDGSRLFVHVAGRRHATPLLIVMLAISITGVVFALDSIPAIFGVTTDAYVIVTANAFALMGLRQLYFLVGHLLERLEHLSQGLAVVLGFIGVKLVFHAMHHEGISWAPDISTAVSLGVVIGVLGLTTLTSIYASRRRSSRPEIRPPGAANRG